MGEPNCAIGATFPGGPILSGYEQARRCAAQKSADLDLSVIAIDLGGGELIQTTRYQVVARADPADRRRHQVGVKAKVEVLCSSPVTQDIFVLVKERGSEATLLAEIRRKALGLISCDRGSPTWKGFVVSRRLTATEASPPVNTIPNDSAGGNCP